MFFQSNHDDRHTSDVLRSRPILESYEDFNVISASDLKMRLEEMIRIKVLLFICIRNLMLSFIFNIEYCFCGIKRT